VNGDRHLPALPAPSDGHSDLATSQEAAMDNDAITELRLARELVDQLLRVVETQAEMIARQQSRIRDLVRAVEALEGGALDAQATRTLV
jgi:hypothetical protein